MSQSSKPGLQPERTRLAWERTSLGFLAIAALVLFRHNGPLAPGRTVVAVLSLLIALIVMAAGQLRARRMRASAWPAVLVLGIATVTLAVVITALMAFSS